MLTERYTKSISDIKGVVCLEK